MINKKRRVYEQEHKKDFWIWFNVAVE